MLSEAAALLLEANDRDKRTYTIEGLPAHLDKMEELFWLIQHMGKAGHSGAIVFFVDGDGNARLTFDNAKEPVPVIEEKVVKSVYAYSLSIS